MLDVGFSEILLTSAIALIVLGPERLPKVARQVGNWMGRARAMARQLSEQLEREVSAEELLKTQSKPSQDDCSWRAKPPIALRAGRHRARSQPLRRPPATPDTPAAPEPTYGLAASATTPAAMHASEAHVADSKPPHE